MLYPSRPRRPSDSAWQPPNLAGEVEELMPPKVQRSLGNCKLHKVSPRATPLKEFRGSRRQCLPIILTVR